jgi:hypothetical protein
MVVQLAQMTRDRTPKKLLFSVPMEDAGIHLMVDFSLSGIQECFFFMVRGYAQSLMLSFLALV